MTEQRLIERALITETGKSKLDPSYTDASAQQAALYQGTVDFLKANPSLHLGDALTAAQKAAVTKPMMWYETKTVDGAAVLVPELVLPQSIQDRYATDFGGSIRGKDVTITADQLTSAGQTIAASGDLSLSAADLSILDYRSVGSIQTRDAYTTTTEDRTIGVASKFSAAGKLTLASSGALRVVGSNLTAGGDLALTGQSVTVAADEDTQARFLGNAWGDTFGEIHRATGFAANLTAAGNLSIIANDGSVVTEGARITADGDMTLRGRDVSILALQSLSTEHYEGDGETDVKRTVNLASQLTAREKLSIAALDGSLEIGASALSADTMSLSAHDVVRLVAAKDVSESRTTGTSSSFLSTTVYDHGSIDEILRFATLEAGSGGLTISSGAGIEEDVRDNAAAASLAERTTQALVAAAAGLQQKLTTNTVSETHVAWNNDRTTASPLVSIVVNLVLAVMLPGIGEALSTALGALVPSFTSFVTSLPTMLQGFVQTVVKPFFTAALKSFVSNALTGAISGTFDLGKILKSTLSAGLTAGVLGAVNSMLPDGLESLVDKPAAQLEAIRAANDGSLLDPKLIGGSLIRVAVDTPIKAAIASAIEGRDFGKTLEADLRSGLASDLVEPALYVGIGDLGVSQGLADGSLSKIVLHAGAGAVGGLIACGGTCAAGGALGAALNEAAIPGEEGFTPAQRQVTAQLLGGFASLVVGDASMSGVTAAMNGTTYNRLLHPQEMTIIEKLADGNQEKKARLVAAACALAHCADGVKPNDPNYTFLLGLQSTGKTFTTELDLLRQQKITVEIPEGTIDAEGWAHHSYQIPAFTYATSEQIADWCSSGTSCTRLAGGVMLIASTTGMAASIVAGGATCLQSIGAGCALAVIGTAVNYDIAYASAGTVVRGEATVPFGEQVLASFGLTHQQAALLYGTLGGAAGVAADASAIGRATASGALGEAEVLGGGEPSENDDPGQRGSLNRS